MHASKGLEFPVVAITGVGHMAFREGQEPSEARLLYVAMTRATERLILTCSRMNVFVGKLGEWERAA